jgi:hypothetical protein
LCAYWPVRNVARDGQHNEYDATLLVNVVPAAPMSDRTCGMYANAEAFMSSTMTTTTLGCAATVVTGAAPPSAREAATVASADTATLDRRRWR